MEFFLLNLPADLSISQLEAYKETLLVELQTEQNVKISDKELIKIDTLGVQFLLAVLRFLMADNRQIEWQISSAILIETIKRLGLENTEFSNYLMQ